jgi:hypothetical protein
MEINNNQKINYFKLQIWKNFIFSLLFFSGSLILPFIGRPPFGSILTLMIWAGFGEVFYNDFWNFYRCLNKLPAIELDENYFIDYISNTKIKWKNIEKIETVNRRGTTFIIFDLADKNKMIYFQQLKNPITRYISLVFHQITPVQTNISSASGRNTDIFASIYQFHKKKKLPIRDTTTNLDN